MRKVNWVIYIVGMMGISSLFFKDDLKIFDIVIGLLIFTMIFRYFQNKEIKKVQDKINSELGEIVEKGKEK